MTPSFLEKIFWTGSKCHLGLKNHRKFGSGPKSETKIPWVEIRVTPWKTAYNDIDFIVFVSDIYRPLLSLRRHSSQEIG
jgi:hypothetical protein